MNTKHLSPEVTIWTDGEYAPQVRALLELMGTAVHPLAVGGPRVGEVDELARSLGVDRFDDLRQMLVSHPAAFWLLACRASVDVEDLAGSLHQGTLVLSLEPVAAELPLLQPAGGKRAGHVADPLGAAGGRVIHLPAFRESPGFLSAVHPQDVLGQPRLISFQSVGRPDEGSLFARLFDAWHAVLSFADLPESIDAAVWGGASSPPEDLRAITGWVTAHARLPGGGAAVVHAADRGAGASRRLLVLGGQGQLQVDDEGYELHCMDGPSAESHRLAQPLGYLDLIVAQWRRLLDRTPARMVVDANPLADRYALACCQACLLSARTRQPENPQQMLALGR